VNAGATVLSSKGGGRLRRGRER